MAKVKRRVEASTATGCDQGASSSASGERCSPTMGDEGEELFDSRDDELFLRAASQYERGMKKKAPPPIGLAAVVAQAAATKALADGLKAVAATSDVLLQDD
jgi:hypothetical protein